MFEPIHGSAFDITGMGIGIALSFITKLGILTDLVIANPVATFWTASEMLAWLGEKEAADQLLDIVEAICEKGIMTKDLGGTATTIEVTNAVCDEIQKRLGKA
jgi:isocitrate/isopropylmalate dehydrogenase